MTDAERTIECALQFVESYIDGTICEWAVNDDDYDGRDPIAWIYDAAAEYADDAWRAGFLHGEADRSAAGDIAKLGCTIVQKWAANSTGGGAVPNTMVQQAAQLAIGVRGNVDYDEVSAVACRWRFHDALGDDTAPTEELRLAFEAAWDIGQYEFAYQLCRPLDEDMIEDEHGDREEVPAAESAG